MASSMGNYIFTTNTVISTELTSEEARQPDVAALLNNTNAYRIQMFDHLLEEKARRAGSSGKMRCLGQMSSTSAGDVVVVVEEEKEKGVGVTNSMTREAAVQGNQVLYARGRIIGNNWADLFVLHYPSWKLLYL
jgi:hypothetical protein